MRVEVNNAKCAAVACALKSLNIPPPIEPWGVKAGNVSYDLPTLNLVMVAICHQTQALHGVVNAVERRGWDYLQYKMQAWADNDSAALTLDRLESFTSEDLRALLDCGQQLSGPDVETRADFIRDCGAQLKTKKANSFTDLYDHCGRRIATGSGNLISSLSQFKAFDDPVMKKSMFLLGLNAATCGWRYADAELLESPVDYHEVRGHLRIGTVEIDSGLRSAINCAEAYRQLHRRCDSKSRHGSDENHR